MTIKSEHSGELTVRINDSGCCEKFNYGGLDIKNCTSASINMCNGGIPELELRFICRSVDLSIKNVATVISIDGLVITVGQYLDKVKPLLEKLADELRAKKKCCALCGC